MANDRVFIANCSYNFHDIKPKADTRLPDAFEVADSSAGHEMSFLPINC